MGGWLYRKNTPPPDYSGNLQYIDTSVKCRARGGAPVSVPLCELVLGQVGAVHRLARRMSSYDAHEPFHLDVALISIYIGLWCYTSC